MYTTLLFLPFCACLAHAVVLSPRQAGLPKCASGCAASIPECTISQNSCQCTSGISQLYACVQGACYSPTDEAKAASIIYSLCGVTDATMVPTTAPDSPSTTSDGASATFVSTMGAPTSVRGSVAHTVIVGITVIIILAVCSVAGWFWRRHWRTKPPTGQGVEHARGLRSDDSFGSSFVDKDVFRAAVWTQEAQRDSPGYGSLPTFNGSLALPRPSQHRNPGSEPLTPATSIWPSPTTSSPVTPQSAASYRIFSTPSPIDHRVTLRALPGLPGSLYDPSSVVLSRSNPGRPVAPNQASHRGGLAIPVAPMYKDRNEPTQERGQYSSASVASTCLPAYEAPPSDGGRVRERRMRSD